MEINNTEVLIWLKEFKQTWLPGTITGDAHLLESIICKLRELELLLKLDHEDENITNDSSTECSLFTALEKLYEKNNEEEETVLSRPAIFIKRIPLVEAELYKPNIWQSIASLVPKRTRKSRKKRSPRFSTKKKNKRNIQIGRTPLSNSVNGNVDEVVTVSNIKKKGTRSINLVQLPSTSSLASTQSNTEEKRQAKRKLRAMDAEDDDLCTLANLSTTNNLNGDIHCDPIARYIGQNGILSQTRRNNETSTMIDDEFPINSEPIRSTTPVPEATLVEDNIPATVEPILQQVIENNDNDSLFNTLNITHDKTFETSSSLIISNNISNSNGLYNDGIEDISNDGIDPLPTRSLTTVNLSQFPLTT